MKEVDLDFVKIEISLGLDNYSGVNALIHSGKTGGYVLLHSEKMQYRSEK